MSDDAALDTLSVEELRRRLYDAEETLRAIREGEADAVVVQRADEDAVFALAGEDNGFRSIMEAMDIGAIALDDQERLLYANAAFCSLIGCDAAQLQRRGLFACLDEASSQAVKETVAHARDGRHQTQFVQAYNGAERHLMITAAPLPLAFGSGFALTFGDVTARVEAAKAEESERIGQAVIASANEAVVVCDLAGRIIHANAAACAIVPGELIGHDFGDALPLTFAAGAGLAQPGDLVAMASRGSAVRALEASAPFADPPMDLLVSAVRALEASAPFADPPMDLLVSAAPLRLSGQAIGGSVVALIDVSERKAIEKRQTLLMHELDHRVKNTLTMVLSICGRTLANAADLEDFRERFTRRIQALAATHNLLADASWTGIDLSAMIRTELIPYVAPAGPRIRIVNLDQSVAPDVAIAFGLVIHELATNAVKYGALSVETGCVSVAGQALGSGLYEIVWTESGGPSVSPPTRHGFGQTLITRSLARGEGTGATVDFAPGGVVCRMVLPLEGSA